MDAGGETSPPQIVAGGRPGFRLVKLSGNLFDDTRGVIG
jgi:hypothetical protein